MRFLSEAWVEALDEAAREDPGLEEATKDLSLTIRQEVTGGPDGDARWHVIIDDGSTSVGVGPAADPTIWFSQDYGTAIDIATGAVSAQRAFMTGRLRIGGDLRVLFSHGVTLAQLEDVFAAVRADTTFPEPVDQDHPSHA
jgi:putative sterol carrier protein